MGAATRSMALAVAAGLVAAAIAMSSADAGPGPGDLLPDLVSDPPSNLELATDAAASGDRMLLRFASYIHNTGQGAAELRGSRSSTAAAMSVAQRVFDGAGSWRDSPSAGTMVYEDADGHNHWHLKRAARYSLWNSARTAEVAPSMKAGFCLEDSQRIDSYGPRAAAYGGSLNTSFCEQGRANALGVLHGVSPGWRDVYPSTLAFQWVDVSLVQPGDYWLRADVDPDGVVVESVEGNQAAWAGAATTIPGYVAQPVDGGQIDPGTSATVTLRGLRFGDAGAAAYRIESGPAHGSLDVAPGTSLNSPTVAYTPAAGFRGSDSFAYSVRDSTSAFPRSPATATVTVRVGVPPSAATLRISGAPATVVAGTSVQLAATVTNGPADVVWSVDGVRGGSGPSGTITAQGLYTAPVRPPGTGAVAIAARIPENGAYDERRVQIVPAPPARPAPLPSGSRADRTTRGRLTKPDVMRVGRRLIVGVVSRRRGTVRLTAYADGRSLGACATRLPAGRRFTCRLRIPRAIARDAAFHVVAELRIRGRVVAVKTRTVELDRVGAAGHGPH